MSDFKANILHQIVCRLGLRPRPRWESLQRSPRPQLDFRGLLRRGGEGRERKGGEARKEQEGKRAGREKEEGKDRVEVGEGRGAGSTPKLKLGPQNYFHGAGAVESAYWTSYN